MLCESASRCAPSPEERFSLGSFRDAPCPGAVKALPVSPRRAGAQAGPGWSSGGGEGVSVPSRCPQPRPVQLGQAGLDVNGRLCGTEPQPRLVVEERRE